MAAVSATASGDVPVGAIILNKENEVIATGVNQRELMHNPVASSIQVREAVRMNSDVDFAVAAWHEGGTWNLEILPDPYNLAAIIKELQNHQTNGGALALIAIAERLARVRLASW